MGTSPAAGPRGRDDPGFPRSASRSTSARSPIHRRSRGQHICRAERSSAAPGRPPWHARSPAPGWLGLYSSWHSPRISGVSIPSHPQPKNANPESSWGRVANVSFPAAAVKNRRKPRNTPEYRGKPRVSADSAKTGNFCPYTPFGGCGARRPWSIMAAMEFVNWPGTYLTAGLLEYPGR